MKIASLFSGIGGFERGILQADPGAEIVFSSEIDKYARQIYKKNYGVEPHGDITKIKASSIPNHDVLCGGFPCQAFSIAGKRRGFEDTRGTLFFEIVRIAKAKRPKLLYLENVRGLLSHDGGRTFQTILRSMDDLGYDAEWQVFNSKNHGVPQNRERVFIIGHLRGAGTRKILPIHIESPIFTDPCKIINYHTMCGKSVSGCGISGTLLCEYGPTSGDGTKIIDENNKIRLMTPVECERLQGYPDNWTEGISNNKQYKCLGNAVTVNVIEFIYRHIMEAVE